jgi:hypothetical protein
VGASFGGARTTMKQVMRKARQPGKMELLFLEGVEKMETRQRAEEEASTKTVSNNRATV